MRLLPILMFLAVLGAAQTAQAQEVPIRTAGAGGRFETQFDPKTEIGGLGPAQAAAFRTRVQRLADQLAAMPAVNAPPAPVCIRLASWIAISTTRGVAAASVDALIPVQFQDGKCSAVTGSGISFGINNPGYAMPDAFRQVAGAEGGTADWHLLPVERREGNVTHMANGTVIIEHGRAPLLVPVTLERYFQEQIRIHEGVVSDLPTGDDVFDDDSLETWRREELPQLLAENEQMLRDMADYLTPEQVAQMRADFEAAMRATEDALAAVAGQSGGMNAEIEAARRTSRGDLDRWLARYDALTPAQRRQPTCFDEQLVDVVVDGSCRPDRMLMEFNPDYFDLSSPERVQLIAFGTSRRQHGTESDEHYRVRMAVYDGVDIRALAAMIE